MKLCLRYIPLAVMLAAVCLLFSSCGYFSQYRNQRNATKLRVGMTKAQVLKIMGEPLRNEVFNKPDIWYYYIDTKWHDGYTTEDECMPLVFRRGRLVGWGQHYYNLNYFSGKVAR